MSNELIAKTNAVPSILTQPASNEVTSAFESAIEGQRRISLDLIPCWTIDHRKKKFRCGDVLVDELIGYPIFWSNARQWWANAYDPRSTEGPTCWSTNGLTPDPLSIQKQSNSCTTCKWAQWGSSKQGKGQDCKLSTIVFLANSNFGNPPISWFSAPPTSYKTLIGNARKPGYLATAKWTPTPNGTPIGMYELVWSQFYLEEGGPTHCIVKAKAIATCPTKEDAQMLAKLRKMVSQVWDDQSSINVAQEPLDNGSDQNHTVDEPVPNHVK